MSTASIAYNKLKSNAHNNILDYVNNRSYIVDPRDIQGNKRRTFVYETDPFPVKVDFDMFPSVILKFPIIVKTSVSADGEVKIVMWKHMIVVRSGYEQDTNSPYKQGKNYFIDICDDLEELFNNRTRINELRALGHEFIKLTEIETDDVIVNGKNVIETVYELTYSKRLSVVA